MAERIIVVGGGAIGGVAAAQMAQSGLDVTVLDADQDHVARLREPGLLFEEVSGQTSRRRLNAVSDPADLGGPFDFALLTVKSPALRAAVTPLVDARLVDTYVALGNGLVHDLVQSLVGRERLIVGLIEWGATNLGPGHLQQTTDAPTVVGELDGSSTERLARLRQVLATIAEAKTTATIASQVWTKLLLNSTFSGLGAAGGCLYRDVVADPVGREVGLRLWREGYDIARALGMTLGEVFATPVDQLVARDDGDRAAAEQALDRLMSRAGPTKASMLQDLQRSRPTEVDVINGGVVSAARSMGLEAPLNAELTAIIHEIEAGTAAAGPESFRRLARISDPVGT
ncbi:2-dehydropantoate 2-reductase [Saccharopolyspora rhizosphaerae]|uniref:2-dehydropantoate 2-reductase n=1 Tax=Saccharopolyspora rhizosphaerae TaxID=2492662 RepID=A0A3R8QDS1_9PSEU|nr:2-dehydropantoate 2-reductase [Saccharopolyspora rhizosphaerae]RRO18682.1 2-dehydropantoate 2-reductase [Saccharopolyspora rhizosphaerae]